MDRRWTKSIALLLVPALLLIACPAPCHAGEFSDNSSQGAAITIGIFATMLVVIFLVSAKSDWDNVFSKAPKQEPAKPDEALIRNVSLVLEPPRVSPTEHNLDRGSEMELANGVNVGLRVQF